MPTGRSLALFDLSVDETAQLHDLAGLRMLPHAIVQRAQNVLACTAGDANTATPLPTLRHANLRLLAQPGGALVWDHRLEDIHLGSFFSEKMLHPDRTFCADLCQDQSPVLLDGDRGVNPGAATAVLRLTL